MRVSNLLEASGPLQASNGIAFQDISSLQCSQSNSASISDPSHMFYTLSYFDPHAFDHSNKFSKQYRLWSWSSCIPPNPVHRTGVQRSSSELHMGINVTFLFTAHNGAVSGIRKSSCKFDIRELLKHYNEHKNEGVAN
jgi:hypothetical protein